MFNDSNLYIPQLHSIIDAGNVLLSDIKPSDWTEQNMIMQKPFPGPFKYSKTPYTREIIDCLMPDHPARWVAVMKGAQIGFSSGVIYPGIGWAIKNHPANIAFIVGAPDLVEKAMGKVDLMIDSCGLRNYIRPQALRNRNNKSGDTNLLKEFPGGYVTLGSANNHKNFAQVDWQIGFFDDFERFKKVSESDGDIRKLIEQRFASYADTHKIFYISTPQVKGTSNIEPAYELGDKRKFLIPCPHCHEFIELVWSTPEGGGIYWKPDDLNKPIKSSVGYICQKCAGFFKDNNKHQQLNDGYWNPTAIPSQEGYYSYHISSLYAPLGMYDWWRYVNNYVEANPYNEPRKEGEWKVFVNTCLGETYQELAEAPKATDIMHYRDYLPGIVPVELSKKDGNGRIVLLTMGTDGNGTLDDARIDFEILAHSETGATYSVLHGSVGTFIPREGSNKADRKHWTYEHNRPNSVWPELDKIMRDWYKGDDGLFYQVNTPGIDMGHMSEHIEPFIDWTIGRYPANPTVGVRGFREEKYKAHGDNLKLFNVGAARNDVYYLQVGLFKDKLAEYMKLKWESGKDDTQPPNYMNFPNPTNGLYMYENYFSHFEAESRSMIKNKDGSSLFRWAKKNSVVQNHMFDCRIYAMALRDIIVARVGKEQGEKEFTWTDFVNFVLS